jgi:hypothetical protein
MLPNRAFGLLTTSLAVAAIAIAMSTSSLASPATLDSRISAAVKALGPAPSAAQVTRAINSVTEDAPPADVVAALNSLHFANSNITTAISATLAAAQASLAKCGALEIEAGSTYKPPRVCKPSKECPCKK